MYVSLNSNPSFDALQMWKKNHIPIRFNAILWRKKRANIVFHQYNQEINQEFVIWGRSFAVKYKSNF